VHFATTLTLPILAKIEKMAATGVCQRQRHQQETRVGAHWLVLLASWIQSLIYALDDAVAVEPKQGRVAEHEDFAVGSVPGRIAGAAAGFATVEVAWNIFAFASRVLASDGNAAAVVEAVVALFDSGMDVVESAAFVAASFVVVASGNASSVEIVTTGAAPDPWSHCFPWHCFAAAAAAVAYYSSPTVWYYESWQTCVCCSAAPGDSTSCAAAWSNATVGIVADFVVPCRYSC